MKSLTVLLSFYFMYKVQSAVLPQLEPKVCLCLGNGRHCFFIDGKIKENSFVTALTDDVNIHLSLNDFKVSPRDACAEHVRKTRDTSVEASSSDKGAHVSVDHTSDNTHANGHVDVDEHGHVSGGGSFEHNNGPVHTHGSVSVDNNGHTHYEVGAKIDIGRK